MSFFEEILSNSSANAMLNKTTAAMTTILSDMTSGSSSINGTTESTLSTTGMIQTTAVPSESIPEIWGFVAAVVAVLLFGSNFVPVKKFETGDGMFFQWVLCASIWMVGLVIQCVRGFPPFYPLAMLGGFLWATGNVTVVPILKTIGLCKGILVWASFNLLAGWTTGRFGLFGLREEIPEHTLLNYLGMSFCLVSAVVYVFIKSESQLNVNDNSCSSPSEYDPLLPRPSQIPDGGVSVQIHQPSRLERLSPFARGILGTVMAIFAGILYGLTFTPVIYIIDHYEGASSNGLDYVFAYFCGIFATSSVYFALYCALMRNRPCLYPSAILPGMASGIMWAVADAAWFIANSALSEAVSFPIITSGPGLIGALWGIIVFKEIKGKRNLALVFMAACIALAGSILTGFSKG